MRKDKELWYDIDQAPRDFMLTSMRQRLEPLVFELAQSVFDMEHWNEVHPDEEPIVVPMDMSLLVLKAQEIIRKGAGN